MEPDVRCLIGSEIKTHLGDAARLRIAVFREFPYLYDGDASAEAEYLASYVNCPRSIFVLADAGGTIVGISTGLPLTDAAMSFRAPFENAGLDLADWFYFGESVLDVAWRGRGVGHRFFDLREEHALNLGFSKVCFCAVERPSGHPLEPPGYRTNHAFWTKRGFVPHPELRTRCSWQQVGSKGKDVENELVFWTRNLSGQM